MAILCYNCRLTDTQKDLRMKMRKLYRIVFFIVPLLVFFFLIGGKKLFRSYPAEKKDFQYLSLFSEVASLVKSDYVEKINPGEKFPGAYSAMLGSLDKFSAYLDAGETVIYNLYRQGNAYECGIYGSKYSNYFFITDVLKHSAAESAGLKPGDMIKAINGKSIYALSFWEMYLSLMTDKPGTIEILLLDRPSNSPSKIKLQTQRSGNGSTVKKIETETGMYLVQLPRINKQGVATLKREFARENIPPSGTPLKLIIDLRKYRGGDLDSFIEITKLFFNKSIPLTLKLKNKQEEFLLGSNSNEALTYLAVVIMNKSTRMYGELLAYLFKIFQSPEQSNPTITLIGSRTRGFISKLKHIPLDDGSSILLTEGLFSINEKNPAETGVMPDIKIKENNSAKIIQRGISLLNRKLKKNPDNAHEKSQEKK